MNNGAFGENFPYSNFHDLNMDWIIQIAKNFLDQYTHIQEIIANGEESLQNLTTSGLTQLQEKADALEALLQQWYDTHSADIANQLADALEDLNEWYTTHENYLDQTLQTKTDTFNQRADTKTAEAIASIPADYSKLSKYVYNLLGETKHIFNVEIGGINTNDGGDDDYLVNRARTDFIFVPATARINVYNYAFNILKYDNLQNYISATGWIAGTRWVTEPGIYRIIYRKDGVEDLTDQLTTIKNATTIIYDMPIYNCAFPVSASDYTTRLPDANNAPFHSAYRLVFNPDSTDIPANLPVPRWTSALTPSLLITYSNYNADDFSGAVQRFITPRGSFIRVYKSGAWQSWKVEGRFKIIVAKDGTGDYSNFSQAVIDAFNIGNCDIHVKAGDYYIASEMKTIFGDDYFDNATPSTQYIGGLPFGNNMHIIGTPETYIQFNGNVTENATVWDQFSLFYSNPFSDSTPEINIIENLWMQSHKMRYCVHLEKEGNNKLHHEFIVRNCKMVIDNRENPQPRGSIAVGMGGAFDSTYIIENNVISQLFSDVARDTTAIYFHNATIGSPYNRCEIRGNYIFFNGTIRIDESIAGSNRCIVIVNNNNVGANIIHKTTDTPRNIDYLEWNNVVR